MSQRRESLNRVSMTECIIMQLKYRSWGEGGMHPSVLMSPQICSYLYYGDVLCFIIK